MASAPASPRLRLHANERIGPVIEPVDACDLVVDPLGRRGQRQITLAREAEDDVATHVAGVLAGSAILKAAADQECAKRAGIPLFEGEATYHPPIVVEAAQHTDFHGVVLSRAVSMSRRDAGRCGQDEGEHRKQALAMKGERHGGTSISLAILS